MNHLFRTARVLLALAVTAVSAPMVRAQATTDFPTRPVQVVVPFAAGSGTDALARLIGERLAARWGQPVVVDNKPGAGGNLGAEIVFRARPDGHTLLFMPGPFIQKTLYPDLRFDYENFVILSAVATGYSVLVANPKLPAQTLPELIAYARANPDKLNYASQGPGSVAHLTGEMFKAMADVKVTHVPYKGNAPALNDLVAGQVDIMFINFGSALPYLKSGRLRGIALGSEKRSASLPQLPTVAETLPGFVSMVWWAMFAPPATPTPIS